MWPEDELHEEKLRQNRQWVTLVWKGWNIPAMRRRGGGVERDERFGLPLLGLVTVSTC